MSWLLIIFVISVVLSPLMWFKQSPRQRHIGELRSDALQYNLQVSLHRRPDARDSDTRLDAVCYQMRFKGLTLQDPWVIHRHSTRGWSSNWRSWNWFGAEAKPCWHSVLNEILINVPRGITAIIVKKDSVGMIWDEAGTSDELRLIADYLDQLTVCAKNNC
ncbi:MAG: hypothetical protein P8Q37_05020 [Porticoccaceae bacterium]|nr:hypothetical protein [Porticoccaceae bacterium]MDG1474244.1 hypothetical protein [Porticoccaceae bacterium]